MSQSPAAAAARGPLDRSRTTSGFTLIELLLSIALAGLVISLVLALSYTVSRAVKDRQTRRTGPVAALRTLDRFARDLTNYFPVEGYEQGGLELLAETSARGPASVLSFCSAERATDEMDTRWFNLFHLTYSLEVEPREPGRLIRTRQPLVGPGALLPPERTVYAEGVDTFLVELFREGEWIDAWEAPPSERGPSAARITLQLANQAPNDAPYTIHLLIPSGLEIRPTTERDEEF